MKNFYVIGNPIEHSLSPKIFKYIFNHFNIRGEYKAQFIENENDFIDFIHSSKKSSSGYNITLPYKSLAYDIVDQLDDSAKKNGSVNCIKVKDSKLIGYNTDGYGFINLVKKNNIAINEKKLLILGYGNTAGTIVRYLMDNINGKIYVYGRNKNKIRNFINNFSMRDNTILKMFNDDSKKIEIIINCLPTKINSKSILSLLSYLSISSADVFIDVNYIETELTREISKKCKFVLGLDMLIFQAIKSFDLWFDTQSKINYLDIKKAIK